MCCRKARNYSGACHGLGYTPQHNGSLLLSAFTAYVAARAGSISDTTKEVHPRPSPLPHMSLISSKSPSTNMTLRLHNKEEEAGVAATGTTTAAESAQNVRTTATANASTSAPVPDDPPPSYQDVIGAAELPGSSTSPRIANRDDSDPGSDSDEAILTPPQHHQNKSANAGHVPGDHKYQADADMSGEDADVEASLPQPLQGTLSPMVQAKVDVLLAALEAYRLGTGRRIPVKRARRDLLNQLYDDQIRNQENATGTRLRPREKAVIWRDLKGLRDDMWTMVRDAKRARRQWR